MPYTHFRYIAYQVPTVARDMMGEAMYNIPPGEASIVAPESALTPILQGNVAGLGNDAERRVERLIGAMLAAQDRIRSEKLLDDAMTLKIFMAPEFYFRPADDFVSYTYDQYRAIKDVLRTTIKGDERFNHWLVIPGTIMWKWGWDKSSLKRPNIPGVKENVYFNSAIYVSRANATLKPSTDKPSKVIEKAYASGMDGIPTGGHKHGNVSAVDPSGKATDDTWKTFNESGCKEWWPKYQTPSKRAKHIFTTGGITFGLDICLEHSYDVDPKTGKVTDIRIVKHVVSENYPKNNIQLHLLTAGGMPVREKSVAANPRGYILRTDGYVLEGSCTTCQKIETYGSGKTQRDLDSTAQLTDIPIETTLDIEKQYFYLYIPNPETDGAIGDETFWNDPGRQQRINIYRRQLLP